MGGRQIDPPLGAHCLGTGAGGWGTAEVVRVSEGGGGSNIGGQIDVGVCLGTGGETHDVVGGPKIG